MPTTICTGPAFGVDARGDLQIRQPRPLPWPYATDIADDNGLMIDSQQGLWVHPQESYAIWRDGYQVSPTNGPLNAGQLMIAAYDDLVITNRTGVRMWAHVLMLFRSYVSMPKEGHGGSNAKVWYDSEPEPGWGPANEMVSTTAARAFICRENFVLDASTWVEPRQTRVIHTRHMYRNYDGGQQTVRSMECRPSGVTLLPFPNDAVTLSRQASDIPAPPPDVNIVDFGAVEGADVSNAVSQNNSKAIQDAIDYVSDQGGGRVRVPDGVFMVRWSPAGPGGPMIRMKDNAVLDLAPSAVIRRNGGGAMFGSLPSDDTTTEGFDGPKNWTIQGGTLDCNGVYARQYDIISVCIQVSHTDGGTVQNTRILNQFANHCVDSAGNRNLTVRNVRFEGWEPPNLATEGEFEGCAYGSHGWCYLEAVQVDKAFRESGASGASDGTATDGLFVSDCWVGPSDVFGAHGVFVGSHGGQRSGGAGVAVEPYRNIQVVKNTVTDYRGTAVRIHAWHDSVVRGNTFVSRHDHPKVGRIDEGAKAPILLHTLRETNWPNRNVVIEDNTLQDTGAPDCAYAAFSVDQPFSWYQGDGTAVPYPGSTQKHEGIVFQDNKTISHQGSNVFNVTNAELVVITGNRWTDPQISGEALVCDDMTNVSDNGPQPATEGRA